MAESPRGFASLRDALQPRTSEPDDVTFLSAASIVNSGLALAADLEDPAGENLVEFMAMLSHSPMFWLAVGSYKQELKSILLNESEDAARAEEFALERLCARMFRAGVAAAGISSGPEGDSK